MFVGTHHCLWLVRYRSLGSNKKITGRVFREPRQPRLWEVWWNYMKFCEIDKEKIHFPNLPVFLGGTHNLWYTTFDVNPHEFYFLTFLVRWWVVEVPVSLDDASKETAVFFWGGGGGGIGNREFFGEKRKTPAIRTCQLNHRSTCYLLTVRVLELFSHHTFKLLKIDQFVWRKPPPGFLDCGLVAIICPSDVYQVPGP